MKLASIGNSAEISCMLTTIILIATSFSTTMKPVLCQDEEYSYTDEEYYQLAAEYQDDLPMPATDESTALQDSESYMDPQDESFSAPAGDVDDNMKQNRGALEKDASSSLSLEGKGGGEESYAEMASRLKCDNPWFWNAFKCTWIDKKANTVGKRTERNAKMSAWILASVLGTVVFWICGLYCLYAWKFRNRGRLNKLREKYAPGRIVLKNGKVKRYQPSADEVEAYEELIKAIIIQEAF